MADDADHASAYQEMLTEWSLASLRVGPHEEPLEKDGVRYCLECTARIPAGRVAAHPAAVRCVECQERIEARF